MWLIDEKHERLGLFDNVLDSGSILGHFCEDFFVGEVVRSEVQIRWIGNVVAHCLSVRPARGGIQSLYSFICCPTSYPTCQKMAEHCLLPEITLPSGIDELNFISHFLSTDTSYPSKRQKTSWRIHGAWLWAVYSGPWLGTLTASHRIIVKTGVANSTTKLYIISPKDQLANEGSRSGLMPHFHNQVPWLNVCGGLNPLGNRRLGICRDVMMGDKENDGGTKIS